MSSFKTKQRVKYDYLPSLKENTLCPALESFTSTKYSSMIVKKTTDNQADVNMTKIVQIVPEDRRRVFESYIEQKVQDIIRTLNMSKSLCGKF